MCVGLMKGGGYRCRSPVSSTEPSDWMNVFYVLLCVWEHIVVVFLK